MLKPPRNNNKGFITHVKAKTTTLFDFATEIVLKHNNFFKIANINQHFIASLLKYWFFVKALRQERQIWVEIKR